MKRSRETRLVPLARTQAMVKRSIGTTTLASTAGMLFAGAAAFGAYAAIGSGFLAGLLFCFCLREGTTFATQWLISRRHGGLP